MWRPLSQFQARLDASKSVSEDGYYSELLVGQELLLKLSTAALIAAVRPLDDRICHAMEQTCVRDNGLYDWAQVVQELMRGRIERRDAIHSTESQRIFNDGYPDLSRLYTEKAGDGDWRFEVASCLDRLRSELDLSFNPPGAKPQLLYWVDNIHVLRNEARAHGFPTVQKRLSVVEYLEQMYRLLVDNLPHLHWPLTYVMPSLPGRSVAVPVDGSTDRVRAPGLSEGVHLGLQGQWVPMRLLTTTRECDRFYLPNGQYKELGDATSADYQEMCYSLDERRRAGASRWTGPRSALERSATAGARDLTGDNNLPPAPEHYVPRPTLESQLSARLNNDKNTVVSLTGRGGIGKTTLALHVLHSSIEEERYGFKFWLSARDVDLEDDHRYSRPKRVRKQVESIGEIAEEFIRLIGVQCGPGESAPEIMAAYVGEKGSSVPLLVVFDNFETVEDPLSLFEWIEETFASPHKALITTRVAGFEGDYSVDVSGMEHTEFEQLVRETGTRLHINDRVSDEYVTELFRETGGHPYVAKVILAEAARHGSKPRRPRTLMATKDEILEALFRAIYEELDGDAQRVFLVAASLKQVLPSWQLEALFLRPSNDSRVDISGSIDKLLKVNLLEKIDRWPTPKSHERFLYTPMVASAFASRVMRGAALEFDVKEAIEADLDAAQQFRPPMGREDVHHGFALPFDRFMRTLENDVAERGRLLSDEEAIVDYLCRHWPTGWSQAAEMYAAVGRPAEAINCLSHYVGEFPDHWAAWMELSRLHALRGAIATQGKVLIQGALSAHRASDRRSRLLEVAGRFLEIARKPRVYEAMKQRDMARQILDGLELANVEYNEGDAAKVVELMVVGQRLEEARKYLRLAIDRRPSNFQLQTLRHQIA